MGLLTAWKNRTQSDLPKGTQPANDQVGTRPQMPEPASDPSSQDIVGTASGAWGRSQDSTWAKAGSLVDQSLSLKTHGK